MPHGDLRHLIQSPFSDVKKSLRYECKCQLVGSAQIQAKLSCNFSALSGYCISTHAPGAPAPHSGNSSFHEAFNEAKFSLVFFYAHL